MRAKTRAKQRELAIAFNHGHPNVFIAIARFQSCADHLAEIAGQGRIAIVDRLVLTDKAAQFLAQGAGACLQRRVLKGFTGIERKNRRDKA